MRTLPLDVRYAPRALLKRPASTAVVVLTLALGLGANAAVFAIIDALVIRPFHFTEADRITLISETQSRRDRRQARDDFPGEFPRLAKKVDEGFTHGGVRRWTSTWSAATSRNVCRESRSRGFFAALGVQPAPAARSRERRSGRPTRSLSLAMWLWLAPIGESSS